MSLWGTQWYSSKILQQRQQNMADWWEISLLGFGSLGNRAAMHIKVYFNSVSLEGCSHGVQMLASHKFKPNDLKEEG